MAPAARRERAETSGAVKLYVAPRTVTARRRVDVRSAGRRRFRQEVAGSRKEARG